MTRVCADFSVWNFRNFLQFGEISLLNYTEKLEKENKIHLRQTLLCDTRFLSLVSSSLNQLHPNEVDWVAKFKGDKISECKLSNGRSRSYKVIKPLLSAGKWVVAKLQGDKSASQSSMELHYPWTSGPLRVSWRIWFGTSLIMVLWLSSLLRVVVSGNIRPKTKLQQTIALYCTLPESAWSGRLEAIIFSNLGIGYTFVLRIQANCKQSKRLAVWSLEPIDRQVMPNHFADSFSGTKGPR